MDVAVLLDAGPVAKDPDPGQASGLGKPGWRLSTNVILEQSRSQGVLMRFFPGCSFD
jgi:hypothetical protein